MFDEKIVELIKEYATYNGVAQVWRAWRDNMLKQGRGVKPEYMELSTLPDRDICLDAQVAEAVIDDFLVWIDAHHDYKLKQDCCPHCGVPLRDGEYHGCIGA